MTMQIFKMMQYILIFSQPPRYPTVTALTVSVHPLPHVAIDYSKRLSLFRKTGLLESPLENMPKLSLTHHSAQCLLTRKSILEH